MMPTFPEHIGALERAIKRHAARLVIIDPIISTMPGGADPNSNVDVRRLLDPLNQLAQRLGITIICIAHTNKGATNARTAVTGSAAWVDATRGTLVFAMEPPEGDQDYTDVVLSGSKSNYTQSNANFAYRVSSVDHMHDTGEIASVPKITWLGASQRSADEVMNMNNEDKRVGFLAKAVKEFIDSTDGATSLQDILREFSDQNPTNVRVTLSRLSKAGKVHCPARGLYQPARMAPKGP